MKVSQIWGLLWFMGGFLIGLCSLSSPSRAGHLIDDLGGAVVFEVSGFTMLEFREAVAKESDTEAED